jgi:nitrogen regulatory protein PII
MKMVQAIVKPSKLNEVKEALTKAGVQGMSDHGLQPGQS